MVNEKTSRMINLIKTMSEKDRLRVAICLADSNLSSINYDKRELLKKADSRLREIDEEYRATHVNMRNYGSVLHTTAMITELSLEEQNQIVMYLHNNV